MIDFIQFAGAIVALTGVLAWLESLNSRCSKLEDFMEQPALKELIDQWKQDMENEE